MHLLGRRSLRGVEQPVATVGRSTRWRPWPLDRWPPGLIDLRRDDWSVAARIVAKSGRTRTRTVPRSSGPGYQTRFGFTPVAVLDDLVDFKGCNPFDCNPRVSVNPLIIAA
jgi:hypothetical protein